MNEEDRLPAENRELPVEPAAAVVEEAAAVVEEKRYTWGEADAGPTVAAPSAEIRDYRVGDPLKNVYNQPRPARLYEEGSPITKSSMAITSMILGLVGLTLVWVPYLGFVLPFLAILFGIIGLAQSSGQEHGGRGMAIAGIVLGAFGLAGAGLILALLGNIVDWARQTFNVW